MRACEVLNDADAFKVWYRRIFANTVSLTVKEYWGIYVHSCLKGIILTFENSHLRVLILVPAPLILSIAKLDAVLVSFTIIFLR